MRLFLATVSDGALGNWEICKQRGLWGTGRGSSRAKHAAGLVAAGDRFVIWRSGSEHGVMALAEATGAAKLVTGVSDVPWPEPDGYEYLIPITVVSEFDPLLEDQIEVAGPPSRTRRFLVTSDKAQSGFVKLDGDLSFEPLMALFETPLDPPATGSDSTSDVREAVSAVLLQRTSSVPEALLHLLDNLPDDDSTELLIIGEEPDGRAVEAELASGRFPQLEGRLKFLTRHGLARYLGADLPGR